MLQSATGILFIMPATTTEQAVIDDLTRKMASLLTQAYETRGDKVGIYNMEDDLFAPRIGSRGFHTCRCGANSTSQDYLIGTLNGKAVVTNYLAVHYLAHHRSDVPEGTLDLINRLDGSEIDPTPELLQSPAVR